jgi:hypothetical protein
VARRRVIVAGMIIIATIDGGVTKLSVQDAKKVEAVAGKPIEEMTTQELDHYVETTGVQEQEVTDEDIRALQ